MIKISVVIATLGTDLLNSTIKSINTGSLVPSEILICIPKEYYKNVENYNYKNVRVIITHSKGQVAQRSEGFLASKYPLVLQLDDDIILNNDCLEQMANYLNHNEIKTAVCPMLYEKISKKYHLFLTQSKNSSLIEKIIFFIINGKKGYEPGKISKSGVNMGLPEFPKTWKGVEWIPGACILHRKENLINYDYYPLKGKAYGEDLFHSQILINNGIKLVRLGKAKCFVDFSSSKVSLLGLFKTYYFYFKSMREFNKIINVLSYRLFIYINFRIIQLILKKMLLLK